MLNKLGHYIFKRMCKDQQLLRNKNAMNMYGLFVRPKDIQRYIYDYINYGIDHMGDDTCMDDEIERDEIGRYWDDPDGKEI